jgi:hypothetical protein
MATKKKTFNAVTASRRWRVQTAKRLAAMTPEERREHLQRTTQAFFAQKPARRLALAH